MLTIHNFRNWGIHVREVVNEMKTRRAAKSLDEGTVVLHWCELSDILVHA